MRSLRTLVAACLLFWPRVAAAGHALSDYEKETLRLALDEIDATIEEAPEGKIVDGTDVVTLDVFEKRDPIPGFFNWFHAKTRPDVIEREILIRPGQPYDQKLVEETERNLRVRQSSAVLVVPTKSTVPGHVRLLAVTKDTWSLRLNWDVVAVNTSVQALYLQPSEENLLGRHKILNGSFGITPSAYSVGLAFIDPRVAGSRMTSTAGANVTWNCDTGNVEGSSGQFTYGKPLYSTRTRWAWSTSMEWSDGIARPAGTRRQSLCNGGGPVSVVLPRTRFSMPFQYHQDHLFGTLGVTRSFGVPLKHNVSFGLEAVRRSYLPVDTEGVPSLPLSEFETLLPVSDTRISPFVQLHSYENRYQRTLDVETLGLQEDFRLGAETWLRAYPASRAVGSSRTLLGVFSGASYTLPVWDGLFQVYGGSNVEVSGPGRSDAEAQAGARAVSPRLPFGRIVLDGYALDRYENYLNPLVSLGGTTRLRGYRPMAFVGPNVVVGNVELRTHPIEIFSFQLGAVAFYDVGDAFRRFSELALRHGAGLGVRVLLPQFDRAVFRVDFGVPLNPRDPQGEMTFIIRFHQAFGAPQMIPSSVAHADPTPDDEGE